MSDLEKLVSILTTKGHHFYHFTDTRNLSSIRQYGLLPMSVLRQRGLITAPGGNEWSFDADKRTGMDRYVHLCFFGEHPMEWVAKQDGRIGESKFLKIHPSVLLTEGVLITDRVSNKVGAWPAPAEAMVGKLDLEVIYTRTDWKDTKIQARLKAAKLCEILIPGGVPLTAIKGF